MVGQSPKFERVLYTTLLPITGRSGSLFGKADASDWPNRLGGEIGFKERRDTAAYETTNETNTAAVK